MADFDWKALVSQVAPAIASVFGTPLLGVGVSALCKALLLPEGSTEQDVATALVAATPETLLALKQADNDFKLQMEKAEISLAEINAKDRDSARVLQTSTKSWVPGLLALGVTLGFFMALGYMLKFGLNKETGGSEALLVMLGALGTAWGSVINFFYGSSAGSSSKDDTIKSLSK